MGLCVRVSRPLPPSTISNPVSRNSAALACLTAPARGTVAVHPRCSTRRVPTLPPLCERDRSLREGKRHIQGHKRARPRPYLPSPTLCGAGAQELGRAPFQGGRFRQTCVGPIPGLELKEGRSFPCSMGCGVPGCWAHCHVSPGWVWGQTLALQHHQPARRPPPIGRSGCVRPRGWLQVGTSQRQDQGEKTWARRA